jgi:hypothetical protein
MSDVEARVSSMLTKMESTYEFNEKQLRLYQELIGQSIEENRQRIAYLDLRISRLSNVLISLAAVILVPLFVAGIDITIKMRSLPTKEYIDDLYVSKPMSVNVSSYILNEQTNVLVEMGYFNKQQGDLWSAIIKKQINNLHGYRSRIEITDNNKYGDK